MKKSILVFLSCLVVFGICGCSGETEAGAGNTETTEMKIEEEVAQQNIEGVYVHTEPRGLGETTTELELALDGTYKVTLVATASDGSGNIHYEFEITGEYSLENNIVTILTAEGVAYATMHSEKADEVTKLEFEVNGVDSDEYLNAMRSDMLKLNDDGTFTMIVE